MRKKSKQELSRLAGSGGSVLRIGISIRLLVALIRVPLFRTLCHLVPPSLTHLVRSAASSVGLVRSIQVEIGCGTRPLSGPWSDPILDRGR